MLDFLKKQRISFYLIVLAALLAIAGFIIFIVTNSIGGYSMPNSGLLISAGIVAVLLIGGGAYAVSRFGAKIWVVAALFVALALMLVTVGVLLRYRLDVAAALFTWDPENTVAWKAFYTGIACVVIYLLASTVLTVSAFLKLGAKEKNGAKE